MLAHVAFSVWVSDDWPTQLFHQSIMLMPSLVRIAPEVEGWAVTMHFEATIFHYLLNLIEIPRLDDILKRCLFNQNPLGVNYAIVSILGRASSIHKHLLVILDGFQISTPIKLPRPLLDFKKLTL